MSQVIQIIRANPRRVAAERTVLAAWFGVMWAALVMAGAANGG